MKIALYYAMPGEIASLIEQGAQLIDEFAGVKVYHIADQPHEVIAVAGGVGKVNAAMAVQFILLKYAPDLIIDVGVAGCFENVAIGTLLNASAFVQHDVDTTAVGDPIGMVSTVNCVEFPVTGFEQASRALDTLGLHYLSGVGATGDWFATGTERARWIRSIFNPLFCDMEGGAIAQVCYRNHVHLMAIKSVSDCLFGDGNYQFNFPKAMANLNQVVMQLIQNLEPISWNA